MTTTHEVTKHNDMVHVTTKVDDKVSVTHEYTQFDWLDHVAAVLSRSCTSSVRRGDMVTYTEDENG